MREPVESEALTSDTSGLSVPDIGASLSWLRESNDPTVQLFLAEHAEGLDANSRGVLLEAVVRSEPVKTVLAAQNTDGSWGSRYEDPKRRIIGTLHTLHAVADLGVRRHPSTARAVEYLADTAHTDDGVFSIDGTRSGVLSCYVGTAAFTYLQCEERELAQHQIDWLLRHQAVSRRGVDLRPSAAEEWGDYLRSRYGGCMAATTCLVGLAKVGRALDLHARSEGDRAAEPLRVSIRNAFLERRLMFDSSEHIVPLGVTASKASDWLLPTFPLDWHTDLIEVLDVVAHAGPPDPRMQPAIDSLLRWRLPDGSWPLRRSFWPADFTVRERKSTRHGSPMVTLRAVRALLACGASV